MNRRSPRPTPVLEIAGRSGKVSFTRPPRVAPWLLSLALACILQPRPTLGIDPPVGEPFNVGFSNSLFADVNEDDAKAAIKAWARNVARQFNLPFNPEPRVFTDLAQATSALRTKTVDAVALTTGEFEQARRATGFSPVFITQVAHRSTERYVVYAHREGTLKTLADLRGRHLLCLRSVRNSLSQLWLDTQLLREDLPPVCQLVGKITRTAKLSSTVLPVFFRQADACLITESGFAVMSDLNPQVGRKLVPIAISPELVPAVFAIRSDFTPAYRDTLIKGLRELNTTPSGQQVLTIFQGDALVEASPEVLECSLQLVTAHQHAPGASDHPASTTPNPARGSTPTARIRAPDVPSRIAR